MPIPKSHIEAINRVNRFVNKKTRSISDITQFGIEENWGLPTTRGGDCEDFALLKKRELTRLGFPSQLLMIATALDKKRNGHAVLVVRTEEGDLILDNVTDKVRKWDDTGYIFLRMQNPTSPTKWVSVASQSRE